MRGPTVVFSEKFAAGPGKFGNAKAIPGAGMNGAAALEIKTAGADIWNTFSVDPGPGSCVRFSAKPVGDVQFFQLLSWSTKANDNARKMYPTLEYADSALEAADRAHVVLHLTEWPEFAALDPEVLGRIVATRRIVDGRNALDPARWRGAGWTYRALGRP